MQGAQLLDAPLVERIAEPWAQAVTGEVEPQAFVLGRAAAAARALHQGVEQRAQQRHVPVLAFAQQMFELAAQAPHFLAVDGLRTRSENALDALHGVGKAWRQGVCRNHWLAVTRRATGIRAASAARHLRY